MAARRRRHPTAGTATPWPRRLLRRIQDLTDCQCPRTDRGTGASLVTGSRAGNQIVHMLPVLTLTLCIFTLVT